METAHLPKIVGPTKPAAETVVGLAKCGHYQAEAYQSWAAELGMLVTAGSDYHGPAVQPDRKLGDRFLSPERFAALEERARGRSGP